MLSESYAIGIDIGGTNFRIGLVDTDGNLSGYEKHSVSTLAGEHAVLRLCSAVSDYISRHGVGRKIAAVCAGFPAILDKKRETVLNAPNVDGFNGVAVRRILEEHLLLPAFIEKDVNLLLINDLKQLHIDSGDIVACYIGTGIGNAIMVDGHLLSGHNGVAGELGHIPFGDSEQLCGCGNRGCTEPLSGGRYLTHLSDTLFPHTPVSRLFAEYGDHPELCRYLERLGRVIAAEINILDPEVLLLGGGVIDMEAFPHECLVSAVLAHTRRPLPHDHLKIHFSNTSDGTGGVAGAGIFAWRKLKQ